MFKCWDARSDNLQFDDEFVSLGRNKNKQFKDELSGVCITKIKYDGCEFSDMRCLNVEYDELAFDFSEIIKNVRKVSDARSDNFKNVGLLSVNSCIQIVN